MSSINRSRNVGHSNRQNPCVITEDSERGNLWILTQEVISTILPGVMDPNKKYSKNQ